MIAFTPYPIPVVVEENKDGYILYVQSGEQFENDIFTVVIRDGGFVKHYNSSQVKIFHNATFGIEKEKPPVETGGDD